MLDARARDPVGRFIAPLVRGLQRTGVTPTVLTLLGLLLTVAGAAMIGAGWLFAGAAVAGGGALLDLFDGPLARATGTAGPRGAFVDTVSDRFGEIAIWTGVAVYMAGNDLAVVLAVIGLGLSLMVPFVRARAETAGVRAMGGVMGKAERNILVLTGFGLSQFAPLEMITLWVMVTLTGLTVGQRIYQTLARLPG